MQNREMPHDHLVGNKHRKGKRPTNAFTSEQVREMNSVQGNMYKCAYCGKEFEIKPWLERQNKSVSGRRFCSKGCHSKYMSEFKSGENSPLWVGGATTYRGKGWLDARKKAVNRDGGYCVDCGKFVGESIPVHHIKPFREFKSAKKANTLDNLVCLCQSCHMIRENNQ